MNLELVLGYIEENADNEDAIRAIARACTTQIKRYRASKKGEIAVIPNKQGEVAVVDKSAIIKNEVSDQATYLAKYMGQEVKKRYPWYTPRIDEWAKDIEAIHRLGCIGESRNKSEQFDWGTIKAVTMFSQQDEFWQQQVRSGANLRKHFNKLLIKAKKHVEDNTIETI